MQLDKVVQFTLLRYILNGMNNIEIKAARLAESILMDWDKEEQVRLAKELACMLLEKNNTDPHETLDSQPLKLDLFEPIVCMYGVKPTIF